MGKNIQTKCAIIVTYNPDIEMLKNLCIKVISSGYNIIIVDNSIDVNFSSISKLKDCQIIYNRENLGIATAQNIGVKAALESNVKIVTFLDQDSDVSDIQLNVLSSEVIKDSTNIYAPIAIDRTTCREYPSLIFNKIGLPSKVYSNDLKDLVVTDLVISSGVTCSIKIFELIGLFDEDLFIDFVDVDWCLRAKKAGIKIYIVPKAVMKHSIGTNVLKIGRIICVQHSPVRTYYKVRNSFLMLYKSDKILFSMKSIFIAITHNFLVSIYSNQKKEYFYYYFKGIIHGLRGKNGKFNK